MLGFFGVKPAAYHGNSAKKSTKQGRAPADITARRRAFRQMHASGYFAIANSWDVGSARYLKGLGFKALTTTSSGAAWSQGRCDGGLDHQAVLDHLREMVAAIDLPTPARVAGGFLSDLR